jgi:hypothetical protein
MELKAKYSPLSLYEVSTKFKILVINRCLIATVTPIPIKDVTFKVTKIPENPLLQISVPAWKDSSNGYCQINYILNMQDGSSLPKFITFQKSNMVIYFNYMKNL